MTGTGVEVGAQAARSRALAVLRLRSRALAVALLPAAAAVVLLAGGATGHISGGSWDVVRWVVTALALLVLLAAAGVALVVARARPALSPTVPIAEESAPDLYRLVRDLADRLDVPAPSAIALTPDCDSWLEDRTHPAHGPPARDRDASAVRGEVSGGARDVRVAPERRPSAAPVLVIGSPFLWWMRVGELRAVLAPVVAGTGPSAHPDIAAARRFVRGLDAAVAVASAPGRGPLVRTVLAGVGWVARLLLRNCRVHAAEMERGVAAAAAERAQTVDYGVRIVAQEQVGLAYAGWDRLLTRVALPAWRMGRWPSRLDAGVVSALTELSRRDRLAEGFASRLGERPACDLLEEPGSVDEAASLLAARLFHGGPAETGPDWAPVAWQEYPEEVVDRKWRMDAARLHRVLDSLDVAHRADPAAQGPEGPTLARILDHLTSAGARNGTSAAPEADGFDLRAGGEADETREADTGREPGAAEAGGAREADVGALTARPTSVSGAAEAHDVREADANTPITRSGPASDTGAADNAHGTGGARDADVGAPTARPGSPSGADETGDACGADANAPTVRPGPASDADLEAVPHGSHDGHHGPDSHDGPGASHDGPGGPSTPITAPAPTTHPAHPTTLTSAPDSDLTPNNPDTPDTPNDPYAPDNPDTPDPRDETPTGILAAGLSAELAREEAAAPPHPAPAGQGPDEALWDDGALPLFPLQPPRTGRELLADHVTAMVCCAAVDTAGAAPGLDWLDGPALLVDGERAADLAPRVLRLVEHGDPFPLREWLARLGVRQEKPVRLV
ncbi:hypothetical protein [Streptomyces sp. 135]|uniref:hypothetical protein n=1 Tax=Streptomyces sp. 135 TaxID=2838850 RepID=UPI001CBCA51A|nr:hypothetical protein [Streptomyces sp. 135]